MKFGRSVALIFLIIAIGLVLFLFTRPRSPRALQQVERGALAGGDVVLITMDTTRRDHLGCYGFEAARTPVIDALAAQSLVFDHAVTGVPSTLPSHASMLTGLEVPSHGVRTNGKYVLSDDRVSLAEVLAEQGYATAAFVATYVLHKRFGLHQGFDEYDNPTKIPRSATDMTDKAVKWLRRQRAEHPDQPVFMWVHYFDPHAPYEPPPEFAAMFPDSPYDGEIAFVDRELGRFLDVLEELGVRDNGVVILTADHGEGLGEHLEEDHSRLVYDTTMRIPLLIALPARLDVVGRIDDITVGTIDLMPTTLGLLGLDPPSPVDGLDLRSATVKRDRLMYLETLAPLTFHGWASVHAMRGVDRKFILAPTPEYYDLADDPNELNNLLEDDSAAAGDLPIELARRMTSWETPIDASRAAAQLDERTARQLAALGYVSTMEDGAVPEARLDAKDAWPVYLLLGRKQPGPMIRDARVLVALPPADKGAFRRALLLADEALRLRPETPHLQLVRGMALYRNGHYEDALRSLAEAPASDEPLARIFIAMTLYQQGEETEARMHLDQIANEVGPDDQPYLEEARALLGQ